MAKSVPHILSCGPTSPFSGHAPQRAALRGLALASRERVPPSTLGVDLPVRLAVPGLWIQTPSRTLDRTLCCQQPQFSSSANGGCSFSPVRSFCGVKDQCAGTQKPDSFFLVLPWPYLGETALASLAGPWVASAGGRATLRAPGQFGPRHGDSHQPPGPPSVGRRRSVTLQVLQARNSSARWRAVLLGSSSFVTCCPAETAVFFFFQS